jgi:hypothetical protein
MLSRYLGPAEVVSWICLGYLWTLCCDFVDNLAECSRVLVSLVPVGSMKAAGLSGSQDTLPTELDLRRVKLEQEQVQGQLVAIVTSVYVTVVVALLIVSVVLTLGDNFPVWLTRSAALEQTMVNLIPMFCLALVAYALKEIFRSLTLGIDGQHLGDVAPNHSCADRKQGKKSNAPSTSAKSHFRHFACFVIGMTLSILSTIIAGVDLRGQMAATAVGLALAGALHVLLLCDEFP